MTARVPPLRGATGDWVLRIHCRNRSYVLKCVEAVGRCLARARMEVRWQRGDNELAVEVGTQEKAEELLGRLDRVSRREGTHFDYTLGHVASGMLDRGRLPRD